MEYLDNAGNVFARDIDSPTELKNEKCQECHIPLSVLGPMYCDVCSALFDALNKTPYFSQIHHEWYNENQSRASHKRQIMGE
jgi:hypothetical protein